MKAYVQFLSVQNNKIVENIGSDGVFILDARNNLACMKYDARTRMSRLQHVATIDGYRIMQGNLKRATCLFEWVRPEVNHLERSDF